MHKVTFILLIVGGLNWLLQGLLNQDLFALLGMDMMGVVARVVYILVGLSAIYEIVTHKKLCKDCTAGGAM